MNALPISLCVRITIVSRGIGDVTESVTVRMEAMSSDAVCIDLLHVHCIDLDCYPGTSTVLTQVATLVHVQY